jgi:hypothetical protein
MNALTVRALARRAVSSNSLIPPTRRGIGAREARHRFDPRIPFDHLIYANLKGRVRLGNGKSGIDGDMKRGIWRTFQVWPSFLDIGTILSAAARPACHWAGFIHPSPPGREAKRAPG